MTRRFATTVVTSTPVLSRPVRERTAPFTAPHAMHAHVVLSIRCRARSAARGRGRHGFARRDDQPVDRRVTRADRDQVVATDDARLRQTRCSPDLHLGADPTNGSSNRSAGDRSQHCQRRVAREHTNGPPTRRRTEISPHNVAAGYHSGAVCAASRVAAATTAGSWGTHRYDAWS